MAAGESAWALLVAPSVRRGYARPACGKATVYRLYASKDELTGVYMDQLEEQILALIDAEVERHGHNNPAAAIRRP
jgi:hypothetical protein